MDLTKQHTFSPPTAVAMCQPKPGVGDIAYAIGQSAQGYVLVARRSKGICAIFIGSNAEELVGDLAAHFPDSTLVVNACALGDDVSKVVRFIAAPGDGLDVTLDMQGTPFQRRVWNAVRAIAVGTTVTYAELARRIGEPKCVRAVASACASNVIAVAIPCHRVVRSNGTLAGYRWGVERKRRLINKEATA